MNKTNKKILLVEDDEDFIFIIQKRFTAEGFLVVTAKDGQDGIAMAEKEKPDLIFSDMLMPKMDGLAMANKIREFDANVPIIFLTNIQDGDNIVQIQKSKNLDYLVKANTRIDDIVAKAKEKLGIA